MLYIMVVIQLFQERINLYKKTSVKPHHSMDEKEVDQLKGKRTNISGNLINIANIVKKGGYNVRGTGTLSRTCLSQIVEYGTQHLSGFSVFSERLLQGCSSLFVSTSLSRLKRGL
jgi:hypothetical protein